MAEWPERSDKQQLSYDYHVVLGTLSMSVSNAARTVFEGRDVLDMQSYMDEFKRITEELDGLAALAAKESRKEF